jgi:catechol 2,3-dioxygenase-like lactoylglutathione lyase family enzyme
VVALELFAGVPVSDYARSLPWYERLLGSPPTFLATPTEAVWELAQHRYFYIEERTDGVGHALITLFVDDLDGQVASIAARRIEPEQRETYDNGVRKITFRDPDGNEIGFGGAPLEV